MPVRSLNSSVFRWPNARVVDEAVRRWAAEAVQRHTGVLRVGYFGSYARGDWGVGSDVDLLVIVERSGLPFLRRPIEWDTTRLPVPADLLVYTQDEWAALRGRFRDTVEREAVWVFIL
jgi:predicted nucleotidyltransferase